MADSYINPYLDSSVFVAWLRGEKLVNGVEREATVSHILSRAGAGDYPITISALTFAEVHKVKGDGKPHLTSAEDERILAFFENDFFVVVEVTREIGEQANRFCQQFNLKPNDAIHLACALRGGCDVLLLWDRPFLAAVSHRSIRVEEPQIIGQRNLLDLVKPQLPIQSADNATPADLTVATEGGSIEPSGHEEQLAAQQPTGDGVDSEKPSIDAVEQPPTISPPERTASASALTTAADSAKADKDAQET